MPKKKYLADQMQSYRIHELHFVHLRTNHDPNSIG